MAKAGSPEDTSILHGQQERGRLCGDPCVLQRSIADQMMLLKPAEREFFRRTAAGGWEAEPDRGTFKEIDPYDDYSLVSQAENEFYGILGRKQYFEIKNVICEDTRCYCYTPPGTKGVPAPEEEPYALLLDREYEYFFTRLLIDPRDRRDPDPFGKPLYDEVHAEWYMFNPDYDEKLDARQSRLGGRRGEWIFPVRSRCRAKVQVFVKFVWHKFYGTCKPIP